MADTDPVSGISKVNPFAAGEGAELAVLEQEKTVDESQLSTESYSRDDAATRASKLAEYHLQLAQIELKIAALEQQRAQAIGPAGDSAAAVIAAGAGIAAGPDHTLNDVASGTSLIAVG